MVFEKLWHAKLVFKLKEVRVHSQFLWGDFFESFFKNSTKRTDFIYFIGTILRRESVKGK